MYIFVYVCPIFLKGVYGYLNFFFSQILEWYRGEGTNYLQNTELGSSKLEALQIQQDHNQFEARARVIQNIVS